MRLHIVRTICRLFISFCWKVRKILSHWEALRISESLSSIEKLDIDRMNAGQIREAAFNRAWLKKIIPKYPYWSDGHLAYAELSLYVGDIDSAYAASITAEKIGNKTEQVKARGIRGVSLLRSGQLEESAKLLEEGYQIDKNFFEEEYIACLIARGNFLEADRILNNPLTKRQTITNQILKSYISKKRECNYSDESS